MNEDDQKSQTDVAPLDGPLHETEVPLSGKERASLGHVKRWFSVTLSRKNLMALTGLFLCFFLVIHLFGNLQLLLPANVAQWQFNFYSKLLSENILIALISYVLFASILAHAFYALFITMKNRRANGKRYEYDRRGVSSKWYSRTMGLLGTIILVFLVIHLRDFWYRLQFGHVPLDNYLAAQKAGPIDVRHSAFTEAEENAQSHLQRLQSIKGSTPTDDFHKALESLKGKICCDKSSFIAASVR